MGRLTRLGLALGLVAATLGTGPAARAGGGEEVRARGTCTARSTSKIKVAEDGGRIEVEFEVDENVAGHAWRVVLKDNGVVFFRGVRTTRAPSGSFEVRRFTGDGAGPDTVLARARNLSTAEVCRAAATL